jgi:nicotinamide-nucleotide amidase
MSEVADASETISTRLKAAKLSLVTAESCTGGLIAAAITEIPG